MKRPATTRVEVRGCEVRFAGALVATASNPKAARRVAEVLDVMRGTAITRQKPLTGAGLVTDLIARADALVEAVLDAFDLGDRRCQEAYFSRAKFRILLQRYVDLRAGVANAKRVADYERKQAANRKGARRSSNGFDEEDPDDWQEHEDEE